MAISPSLLPAVLFFYLSIISKPRDVITSAGGDIHRHLVDEIREAELKVIRLESILEESISLLNSKNIYINENEKKAELTTSEVNHLQSVVFAMKNDSSSANERINQLEEEVRLLWGTARKNNFELHTLDSKAQDAEKRLEITESKVETMAAIVTERWIQIQHLEQALVIAQRGIIEVEKQVQRCSFLKYVKNEFGNLFDEGWEMVERSWSAVKVNHQQLQMFVKKEMQKWKYTAALANKEVVFFVASAVITFPALSLGMFLLNSFS